MTKQINTVIYVLPYAVILILSIVLWAVSNREQPVCLNYNEALYDINLKLDKLQRWEKICWKMTQWDFYKKYWYDYSLWATESNEMMEYCIDSISKMPYDNSIWKQ